MTSPNSTSRSTANTSSSDMTTSGTLDAGPDISGMSKAEEGSNQDSTAAQAKSQNTDRSNPKDAAAEVGANLDTVPGTVTFVDAYITPIPEIICFARRMEDVLQKALSEFADSHPDPGRATSEDASMLMSITPIPEIISFVRKMENALQKAMIEFADSHPGVHGGNSKPKVGEQNNLASQAQPVAAANEQ